ncbi:GNAT family N-acetyltransferase [Vibrio cholerae]|uniref:GNAT family N-acetyltransferase n=1 Tax=Vibrio cholerae TaxID=666 RepID=UPI00215BF12C|nr:GNAT family N-acetyltransferase [Vibrio cholerae]ELJ8486937.1 GNAT family N-acetyltransferase [Vibrio cholerae]MCR9709130.1 GNAT family N-acetyltransferase [Vibrio cholerae]HDL9486871.1 GNAT family N-acetyltransferase [Vibrio cholerae]
MFLEAKTVRLRLVTEQDAEFILQLRLDDKYNQFLSSVTPDLRSQKDWIRKYKDDEQSKKQFYFIIERLDGTPCGTVRIYDLRDESFCWGSWILNENKTRYAALESAFLVYKFGFEQLGYQKSHFDVMKGNQKVISFHKKMGAVEVSSDDENYYFEINKYSVDETQNKLMSKLK